VEDEENVVYLAILILASLTFVGCAYTPTYYDGPYVQQVPHYSQDTQDPDCYRHYGAMPGYCDSVYHRDHK